MWALWLKACNASSILTRKSFQWRSLVHCWRYASGLYVQMSWIQSLYVFHIYLSYSVNGCLMIWAAYILLTRILSLCRPCCIKSFPIQLLRSRFSPFLLFFSYNNMLAWSEQRMIQVTLICVTRGLDPSALPDIASKINLVVVVMICMLCTVVLMHESDPGTALAWLSSCSSPFFCHEGLVHAIHLISNDILIWLLVQNLLVIKHDDEVWWHAEF